VIAALVLLAATVAATPRIETFSAPAGHIPTEITRQGDRMTFISWTNWPALEPHLGHITTAGKVETKPLEKDYMPGLFSSAPDGSLWMSDVHQPVLWHFRTDGSVEKVDISRTTLGVAVDKAGTIWATHPDDTEVTRFNADGSINTEYQAGRNRFKMAKSKRTNAPAGTTPTFAKESQNANRRDVRPAWIVVGVDGNMWYAEPASGAIGMMTVEGRQQRFKLPREWGRPGRIVTGQDGLLWFVVPNRKILGQISQDGFVSSVDIPSPATSIAVDAAGRVWFSTAKEIAYVQPDATITRVPLGKGEHTILSMSEGPDGAMWFVDQSTKKIGRVTLK